jgi:pSer/pThr/pTyr-binding forkhead associated (FHA) protein
LGLAVLAAGVWGAIRGYEVWRRRDKARRKQAAPGPTEPGSTGTPKTDSWPGSDTPLAQLRVVEGPQREGEVIPISERGVVIGRGEGTLEGTGATPLRLPDDEQHRVGRKHAEIVLDPTTGDRTFILRDLESTNGTFVNGEKITERVLQPGDEIDIGHRYRLRFEEV